jgi:hypothetical protein
MVPEDSDVEYFARFKLVKLATDPVAWFHEMVGTTETERSGGTGGTYLPDDCD